MLNAQEKTRVEILNADVLLFDESLGSGAKRLIGNVAFRHESSLMYADSAHFFSNNSLKAYGHVHINQGDTVHLYGDFLDYSGNTKKAIVTGDNLRLTDPSMTLYTNRINYDMNKAEAWYPNFGKIINKENTLTSNNGRYFSRLKEFVFTSNVVLTNPDYRITSDSLRHNTETEQSRFFGPTHLYGKEERMYCEKGRYDKLNEKVHLEGNALVRKEGQQLKANVLDFDDRSGKGRAVGQVALSDSLENLTVFGDLADYYKQRDSIVVSGKALMQRVFTSDTLFLHADTLLAYKLPENDSVSASKKDSASASAKAPDLRMVLAWYKVRFFKTDMQGLCDSLVYAPPDSLMKMFGTPVLWSDSSQMNARFIRIRMVENKMEKLFLDLNAGILQEVDSGRFNQIKGKNITGLLKDDELEKVFVNGNASNVYFITDEENKFIGVNRTDCSDMEVQFAEGKASQVRFFTKPAGNMDPPTDNPDGAPKLSELFWLEAQRPKDRLDVMQWKELPLDFLLVQSTKRVKTSGQNRTKKQEVKSNDNKNP